MSAFDAIGEDQVDAALDVASTEQMGRALARKVEKLANAVDAAERDAQDSDDVMVVAGCAAMARYSADTASDCAQAVMSIIGKGDLRVTNGALHQSTKARKLAARVERRWAQLKAAKGGVA